MSWKENLDFKTIKTVWKQEKIKPLKQLESGFKKTQLNGINIILKK